MKFRFKSFKGDKTSSDDASAGCPPQDPQARRKDQIRRAQKTHRERKEAYTKGLESEVVQLRANEGRLMQETKALYAEINMLRNTLKQNGLPVPTIALQSLPDNTPGLALGEPSFNLSIDARSKTEHQRIQIRRNVSNAHQQPQGLALTNENAQSAVVQKNTASNFFQPFSISTQAQSFPPTATPSQPSIANLDVTAIGMDFVLTLESPCLSHNIPPTHDAPTGHALTVSATLLHQHPSSPELRLAPSHTHPTPWNFPSLGIERLLELSESVPLFEGELTPVQAWDKVRRHPEFGTLGSERLEGLKGALLKGVKCYGFGGVIDEVVFESAVFDAFVVGRVF